MRESRSTVEPIVLESLSLQARHRYDVTVDPESNAPPVPVDVWVGQAHHPCLGLVGGVHGDEYEGILALQEMQRELDPRQLRGSLLFITVANPFAFAAAQRRTPEDDKDLNRVFPGRADGSITERLAELLCCKLLRQADAVFTLHGSTATGVLSPWLEFLDRPGDVGRVSYEMARASGFTDLIALTGRPGRLLTALGELGVPLIEGEVGGRGTTRRENVAFYVERAYAVARHLGVFDGQDRLSQEQASRGRVSPGQVAPQIWRLDLNVEAQADGIFLREVTLKQAVRKGERLGVILDMRGEVIAEVHAPEDGVISGYRDHVGVRAGQSVFTLWTPVTERPQSTVAKLY